MTDLFGIFTPYFAVFFLMGFFIYPYYRLNNYHQDSIKWVCLLVFIMFFGLHENVGDDYEVYRSLYETLTLGDMSTFEPGFVLFAWCFKMLNLPFWCFLLGCSCLINGLLFAFLWRSKDNIPFVLCIFLAMGGIMLEMTYLRSTISLMIFANSIVYLHSKKATRYIALNSIGILFHYSSILYLALYYFLPHKFSQKSIAIIMLFAFVFSMFHIPLLAPLAFILGQYHSETLSDLSSYYLSTNMYLGFSLGTIERLFTVFAVICFYDRLTSSVKGVIAVNSFMIYFLLYSFLSAYAMLGLRMSNMFIYGYWLLWPMVLECIDNKMTKTSVSLLMSVYMIIRIAGLSNLPQWQYKTILLTY